MQQIDVFQKEGGGDEKRLNKKFICIAHGQTLVKGKAWGGGQNRVERIQVGKRRIFVILSTKKLIK